MREKLEGFACRLLLAAALWFIWFGVTRAGEIGCYECLTRAIPSTRAGEIVICQPEGWQWGKKEKTAPFKPVKICGLSAKQAELISQPYKVNGETVYTHRFIYWEALEEGEPGVIGDQVSGQAVTPAEVEALSLEDLETFTLEAERN